MALYEKKFKEKDPTIKGVAAPASGSFSETEYKNIERKQGKRFLSWTCIVYPGESLPENWKSILGDLMIPWAMSPLHDEDINALGEKKKAHRHLLLSFHSVKSYSQIEEITKYLGAPAPQPCRDTRGMVRYFLHLDNPEKAQYKREDIEYGGGFDLETALKATATEEEEILDAICDFLEENWITEFAAANKWIRHNKKEWRTVFRKNSFYLSQIIKSQRHNSQQ
jgi:hypothetical protein